MSRTLHRLHTQVTRGGFERLLAGDGEWEPVEGEPARRVNGRHTTFKRGRLCCVQSVMRVGRKVVPVGPMATARSWGDLAKVVGVEQ